MKKILNKKINTGITLIALVITIVVLIILATVVVNLSLGDNGIFNRAREAKQQYQNAEGQEQTDIAKATNEINSYVDGNRGTVTLTEEEYQIFKNITTFSTEEKIVGTWINGKPIYQITIDLGTSTQVPKDNWLEINFSCTAHNIDTLLEGYGTNGSLDENYNPVITTRTCPVMLTYSVDALHSDNLFIMASRPNGNPRLQYITIKYTKTTD